MEEGKVSEPEVSAAWEGCGVEGRPMLSSTVAGSERPHGIRVGAWIR